MFYSRLYQLLSTLTVASFALTAPVEATGGAGLDGIIKIGNGTRFREFKAKPRFKKMLEFDLPWTLESEEFLDPVTIKAVYGNRAGQTGSISGELNGTIDNTAATAIVNIQPDGDFEERVNVTFTIHTDDGADIDVEMNAALLIPAENVDPLFTNLVLPNGYEGLA